MSISLDTAQDFQTEMKKMDRLYLLHLIRLVNRARSGLQGVLGKKEKATGSASNKDRLQKVQVFLHVHNVTCY